MPSDPARRTRLVWQCRAVPALSALLPSTPASPGPDCAQLLPGCCDSPARRSCTSFGSQRLTAHRRLVAHVVGDIGPKDPLQMSAAEHQRPVQALGPDGPDPSFSEGVRPRRPDRGEDDLDAVACEHRVEAGGVLCVPVPDQKPEGSPASEVERQVPRLLGDPGEAGFLVAPARWTRLVRSSITKNT